MKKILILGGFGFLGKNLNKIFEKSNYQVYNKSRRNGCDMLDYNSLHSVIKEINPDYKFPNMLLSTIIEGAHLQVFFAEHLPSLTNVQKNKDYI